MPIRSDPPRKTVAIQRCMSILCRLAKGPADRDTLMDYVQCELDFGVYQDAESKAGQREFEGDLAWLRELGVVIDYDRTERQYVLVSYGAFSPVSLSEAELNMLAFIAESFGAHAPNGEGVQRLVQRIADWLQDSQRDSLPQRRQQFRLDLRRRDEQPIDPRVSQTVDRAVKERRRLRFRYRTPGQADEQPRAHLVEPWGFTFDTFRGHLYLDAYWLASDGPHGRVKQGKWQRFRLDRILADGMELLPDRLPPSQPPRPRIRLEYLLSPAVARGGQVTRHFDSMQVHEADAQGWVRVTATTDNLFQALQLLLGYGPNCRVIGGPEARREMRKLVTGMAALYREETGS